MYYRVQLCRDDGTCVVDTTFQRNAKQYWSADLGCPITASKDDLIHCFQVVEMVNIIHVLM